MPINYTQSVVNFEKDKIKKIDLKTSINHGKSYNLSTFQKILLAANGTVTAALEAYLSEPIKVVKLSETLANINLDFLNIQLDKEQVIVRKVLLQGKYSGRNFIYASSFILVDNLDKEFSDELLNTNKTIGELWVERKVETYKEIIDYGKHSANELSNYFSIEPDENLIFRTYYVTSQRKIIMIITEKFPQTFFKEQVL
ncbi:MAG: chorismate--pyruvate lyase family protein [Rivularia sp. (in: cyanobacteria)]